MFDRGPRLAPPMAGVDKAATGSLRVAIVVIFQDEQEYIGRFLHSLSNQTRTPDSVLLIDDGSTDASPEIASAFASRSSYARVLRRPPRPGGGDRLAEANELRAFQWAVLQIESRWDVVAKMDADLILARATVEAVAQAFAQTPRLGMAGPALYEIRRDGGLVPMGDVASPPEHVEGPAKFYRRQCLSDISPISPLLGWDTADEFDARRHGWLTKAVDVPGGVCIHARRMGTHGPILRSFRRWGVCAWGYGSHPLHVACFAGLLMWHRPPRLVGGLNFLVGWILAWLRGAPRVDPDLRAYVRRHQLAGLSRRFAGLPREILTGRRARYDPRRGF
jgi:biofilm PGA synthesis N-glycosyltransferase PgaC